MAYKKVNDNEELKPLKELMRNANSFIEPHRRAWMSIYEQVYNGTPTSDLEDWQATFSLPTLNQAVNDAKTDLVDALINKSDWYDLDERNPSDVEAKALKTPLKKLTDYYLASSNAKTICNNIIGAAMIAIGDVAVHWQQKKQLNPNWVSWYSRKQSTSPTDKVKQYASMTPEDIANALEGVGMDLEGFVAGEKMDKEPAKYVEVGTLRFDVPHFKNTYWDAYATTINTSRWRAYEFELQDYQVKEYQRAGVFTQAASQLLKRKGNNGCYTFTAYYGPRFKMTDGVKEAVNDGYYCIWSHDIIVASGDYPYIEVDEATHPMVTAIAKSVPFNNAGQSPAEYATEMARWHDHNWRIVCDQLRFGILGFNAVNTHMIENREILDNGLEPGSLILVKGDPREAFSHIALTDNRENQYHPVNETLRNYIIQSIGTTGLGGAGLKSRATSAEVRAVQDSASKSIGSMAQELQESFVLPFLQKVFARVIQFGLKDLATNPSAQAVLTEDELQLLLQLSEDMQIKILQTFYRFKLRDYTSKDEDAQKLDNIASLLNAAGQNPYFQQAINYKKLLSLLTDLLGLKEEALLNTEPSELDVIASENLLLEQGKPVMPGQTDNHQLHLEQQQPGPNATQAAIQHWQMHQQYASAMQKNVDNKQEM